MGKIFLKTVMAMDEAVLFQYVSDLHLEARKAWTFIPARAPFLILCGDIGNPKKSIFYDFLQSVSERFRLVFLVAGNHEYFGGIMHETEQDLQQVLQSFPNIIYLQNSAYTLHVGDRTFSLIGSTLWAPCPLNIELRDFRRIRTGSERRFNAVDMNRLYLKSVAAVNHLIHHAIARGREIIMITHHAPFLEANGHYFNHPAASSYASDLRHLIFPSVRAWFYGHTHLNMRRRINQCFLGTNALGYPGEQVDNYQRAAIAYI